MTYTTNSVKVAKTGIQIGYIDDSGATSTQNLNFDNKTLTLDSGLTISAGNASMAGDLAVAGGANFGGVMHAEGAATMASTLAVTGAVSAASTLAVAGDANLASALNVSGASHLVGALTQDGAASFGSTVAVSGAASLASTLDVTGASHLASSLLVDGASHLVGALTQDGAASFGSTLDVTGASHLDSTLQVDGAASLGDTLTVSGSTTLNSGVTINGTSATNGAMTVSGAGSIGGALNVSGASSLGSTLDVTGATTLASTLDVSGASHLVGATTIDGAASLGSTLDVTGASHLASTLLVDGASHVVGALTQDGAASFGSTVDVTGAAHLASTLLVDGAASLGSTLDVTGAAHLSSSLLVDGASHVVGALTQDGAASFGSTLNVAGASSLGSTLAVAGNATLASQLNVTGAASLSSTLAVTGATTVSSSLSVTGAATIGSTLNVAGAATFQNNMTVNGNLTVLGSQTSVNTTSMEVKDNAILIADGNDADAIQSGIMMQYKPDGSAAVKYAGMKRLPATGEFVFFKDAADKISEPLSAEQIAAHQPYSVAGNWIQINVNGGAKKLASYKITANEDAGTPINMYIVGSNDNGATWRLIHHHTNISRGTTITTTGDNADVAFSMIRFVMAKFVHQPQGHQYYDKGLVGWSEFDIYDQNGAPIPNTVTNNADWSTPPFPYAPPPPTWIFNVWTSPGGYLADYNYQNDYIGNKSTTITPNPLVMANASAADVYATVLADGFTCASDMNLKKDIVELDGALQKMDLIRGVYYQWKDENKPRERQVGVIAQEIQAVYPELVQASAEQHLTVDYPKLTAVLIAALKELKAEVDALKKQ